MVFLFWYGGIFVVVWCFCGSGVIVFLWWYLYFFVVVFLYICFCQGSIFIILRKNYAKNINITSVKNICYKNSPYTTHIQTYSKYFLHLINFITFGISEI